MIEENKPASKRTDYQRQGGDWFEHNNNNDIKNNNKNEITRPASASGRRPPPNGQLAATHIEKVYLPVFSQINQGFENYYAWGSLLFLGAYKGI